MSSHSRVPSENTTTIFHEQTASSIHLIWDKPKDEDTFEGFVIRHKEHGSKQKFEIQNIQQIDENTITLDNLKSETEYIIKGSISRNNGTVDQLFETVCKTKPSPLSNLFCKSTLLDKNPPTYKLPCTLYVKEKECLRECHIVSDYEQPSFRDGTSREKTILLVGATGSGKSTLIDAMINHIVDVSFGDRGRFKTIDLTENEKQKKGKEFESQTSTTTCYRLPYQDGFSVTFSMNIIDTPGFDDTGGKSYDKKIPEQIRKLFESLVHSLHAVCIVVPLSSTRLTEAQKWVFNNILSLFGANIKDIIYPCITFDDGGEAKCLFALKEAGIHFKTHFAFNNSDLFGVTPSVTLFQQRRKSMNDFFTKIDDVAPRCLKDSVSVLTKRNEVTIKLASIQDKIRIQVQEINTINKMDAFFERFEEEMISMVNFTYEDSVPTKVRNKSKKKSVNCDVCKESCHKKCLVPFDIFLPTCEAFSKGICNICKNKCPKDKHVREDYEYEIVFIKEQRSSEYMKKEFRDYIEMNRKKIKKSEKDKIKTSLKELTGMLQNVEELITTLNKIALKTEHYSTENYLDQLIDLENEKQEAGYSTRKDFIGKMKNTLRANKSLEDDMENLTVNMH